MKTDWHWVSGQNAIRYGSHQSAGNPYERAVIHNPLKSLLHPFSQLQPNNSASYLPSSSSFILSSSNLQYLSILRMSNGNPPDTRSELQDIIAIDSDSDESDISSCIPSSDTLGK
jgi:hypothetical protein